MSKKQFIKRKILIINKLKTKPCSFIEMQKHLQYQSQLDEENYDISIRTLQRDISEIKSLFDIDIKFNRSEGIYEIIENQNEIRNERLLETFTVLDTIKLAQNFSDEIVFEQRKSSGLENIFILVHAIKNQLEISFLHKKYWDETPTQKTIQPYFVKEVKQRWYIIGLDVSNQQIRTFGLDRISEINVTKNNFKKPKTATDLNLFQYSFGIIFEEEKPQKVVLQFSSSQANFVKALPLHHSQKIVSDNQDFCVIELLIHPTYDFIMEILSMGKEVKVLEPQNLREKIIKMLVESLNNYNF